MITMKKTNIIIDGNFCAFSLFSLFSNYGATKNPLKTEKNQITFVQELTNRFFSILNQLPKGGSVIFCLDSKSWRKELMKTYKESRQDAEGNKGIMDNETKHIFYSLLSEFGIILKNIGIHVSRVSGAEADDLIFAWTKKFKNLGENTIIITGDKDMTQLVCGPEAPWTVVWSNRKNINKIYAVSDWKDTLGHIQSNSIFEFNITNDEDSMLKLIRDAGIGIEIMFTDYYLLHKILIGDDGDDVPSVWKVAKGDKFIRVTDKKAEKIIETLSKDINVKDFMARWGEPELLDNLSGIILRVMGDIDGVDQRAAVTESLLLNARLVWLNEEMLPKDLNQRIDESIINSLNDIKIDRSKWNKKSALEGTKYSKDSVHYLGRAFDPFNLIELPTEDDFI